MKVPSKAAAGSWAAVAGWTGCGERRPDRRVRPVSLSLVGCPNDGLSAVDGDTKGITSRPWSTSKNCGDYTTMKCWHRF